MKRHTLFLSLATAAALVLSACTITVEPGPPPPRSPDDDKTAANDEMSPVASYDLAAGEDILVRLIVDTNRELVFIELDSEIDLAVQANNGTSQRTTLASSSSSAFFAPGATGLGASGLTQGNLSPQALNTLVNCGGSCVALRAAAHDQLFALITNTSGSRQTVDLYAFGRAVQDTTENTNNSSTNPPVVASGADEQGAIETLGDIDYWRVASNGTIRFVAAHPELDLVLRARDFTGEVFGPYRDGDTFAVFANDILWVESNNGRAAAAGSSNYAISHTP